MIQEKMESIVLDTVEPFGAITEINYSKFRHLCNRQAALKITLLLLCKLFLHSCLWLIKLTTTVVLVLAVFYCKGA